MRLLLVGSHLLRKGAQARRSCSLPDALSPGRLPLRYGGYGAGGRSRSQSTVASLRAEKRSLVKESKAYQEATKIAKFALTELSLFATSSIKSKEREVQFLIAENDRKILEVAKYEMQFSIRTIFNGLLRLALPNSKLAGGAMYKEFLSTYVLKTKELDCQGLSPSAVKLYNDLVKKPQFASMDKAPLPSWVVTFKEQYGTFNNGQHSLPQLNALWTAKGIACGGDSVERMFMQTFAIALLQEHCINESIAILPSEFDSVAVLSQTLDRVVGHVTEGKFVPVPDPDPEAEAEAKAPTPPPAASS